MKEFEVLLAGNPNVGKSTVFNALTGLKQHTGNWTGKTVEGCEGSYLSKESPFNITDLPGTYSLSAFSEEEKVTQKALNKKQYDCTVIVADAGALERNLSLALEVLSLQKRAVLCLNLYDEALKKGFRIDENKLGEELGVPVVKCCAYKKHGINDLISVVSDVCERKTESNNYYGAFDDLNNKDRLITKTAREIFTSCVSKTNSGKKSQRDLRIDSVLTSKATGIPIMILLCAILFWITAVGANYPSEWLSRLFEFIKSELVDLFSMLSVPQFVKGILIDGVYTTLSWVVAVMLPPMAIFFPLFALMEDSGYLPRIAFNLDRCFSKCGAHGKQSLCMMMGIGCNACGVTGCRIIESKKERLIALLTNNFMPCNGRLPILIALIMMYFTGNPFGILSSVKVTAILTLILIFCVVLTLLISKILSKALSGETYSGFALELPPYRKPQIIKTIVRSFLDKTLRVLIRAVAVAAPAGAIIWLCANIYIGDVSVLKHLTDFFDPLGRFLGLDGVIIMAFILGFPANETVIPIMLMAYCSKGVMTGFTDYDSLYSILTQNGWTLTTAVCMIIMTVAHFPCSTTCLTIKKETGSINWTLLSMAVPTAAGIVLCGAVSHIIN